MAFVNTLKNHLIAQGGNYHTDNYDYHSKPKTVAFSKRVINFLKRFLYTRWSLKLLFSSSWFFQNVFLGTGFGYKKYLGAFEFMFENLSDSESKKLFLDILAYRLLGHVKIKLPLSSPIYWETMDKLIALRSETDTIELPYRPWTLYFHDLSSLGVQVQVYLHSIALYRTFFVPHYYKETESEGVIAVEPGDIALDLGGCYGDTAMYFSQLAGPSGKVYTFEFIPSNIEIMNRNLDLNPELKTNIHLLPHPVWEESDKQMYYEDMGAASRIGFKHKEGWIPVKTLSIDDCVTRYDLPKVDFIKTDIEGAEPWAIKGAEETLKRFKPKLAISIYHSLDDFTGIIKQIDDLNLGYKFYLRHATIYSAETVLFCWAK